MKKVLLLLLSFALILCSCSSDPIDGSGLIQYGSNSIYKLMPTDGGVDTLELKYLEKYDIWNLFTTADTAFVKNEEVDDLMKKMMPVGSKTDLQMEGDSIAHGPWFTFKRIDRRRIELSVEPNTGEQARVIHSVVRDRNLLRPNYIGEHHFMIYQKGVE